MKSSGTAWRWMAGLALAGACVARAEISLDDEPAPDPSEPAAIAVPDPTRGGPRAGKIFDKDPGVVITNRPSGRGAFFVAGGMDREQAPERRTVYKIVPIDDVSAPPAGLLTLLNGENFRGGLLDVTGEAVRWVHPLALETMEFRPEVVRQADLAPDGAPSGDRDAGPRDAAWVLLTNGDVLVGSLRSVGSDSILLQTRHLGLLRVARRFAERIIVSAPGARVCYFGPRRSGEWIAGRRTSPESVLLREGCLSGRIPGPAVLAGRLPERARITLDCERWSRDSSIVIGFFLGATEGRTESGETVAGPWVGYQLRFGNGMVNLQRMTCDSEVAWHGIGRYERIELPEFERARRGQITVLASVPERRVILLAEGRVLKEWKDLDPMDKPGDGLSLSTTVPLSRISVREWDGQTAVTVAAEESQDVLLLANHDQVSGRLLGIEDESVGLESAGGNLVFPKDRVQEVVFASGALEEARLRVKDTLALLEDGTRLTLAMSQLDANGLSGFSDSVGTLTIPRGALRQICPRHYDD